MKRTRVVRVPVDTDNYLEELKKKYRKEMGFEPSKTDTAGLMAKEHEFLRQKYKKDSEEFRML